MKVFLSYSRRDAEFVDRLDQALTKGGYEVWGDSAAIATGGEDRWHRSMVKAVRESDTVVLVLSPESTASEHVARELSVAAESRRRIVPVVYRECELPDRFAYELAGLQQVDFASAEFADGTRDLITQLGPPGAQVRRPGEVMPPAGPTLTTPADPLATTTPLAWANDDPATDASQERPPNRRWRALGLGAGAVAIVGIVVALLTLGGGDPDDAATATTVRPRSALSTTTARSVATTAAPTTTVPGDRRAVGIVLQWAAATSKRDWASAARIDISGTVADYDARYGRPDAPSHMERVDLHVDGIAPYGTSWLVKGAAMVQGTSSRGPSTDVVCSFWVVDPTRNVAAWNVVEARTVRPPIAAAGYADSYARYCT
jgi:hypothetical protein